MFESVMLRSPPAGRWLKLDFITIGGSGLFFFSTFLLPRSNKPTLT